MVHGRYLHQFPMAAVINYHKFSGLNSPDLLLCSSGGHKFEMDLTRLKPRSRLGCIPSEGSGGRYVSLFFQFLEATCVPSSMALFLHLQSQQ